MTDLITGVNALFTMFWTQLASFASFLVTSLIGQILIFSLAIGFIVYILNAIFGVFNKK